MMKVSVGIGLRPRSKETFALARANKDEKKRKVPQEKGEENLNGRAKKTKEEKCHERTARRERK
jgi:hypothetical protein